MDVPQKRDEVPQVPMNESFVANYSLIMQNSLNEIKLVLSSYRDNLSDSLPPDGSRITVHVF